MITTQHTVHTGVSTGNLLCRFVSESMVEQKKIMAIPDESDEIDYYGCVSYMNMAINISSAKTLVLKLQQLSCWVIFSE